LLWPVTPGKGDRAQRRLIQAAATVFGEKGLKGATVREIARAAGQNVAAITYYFGGKEKLYAAVLESVAGLLRETMSDLLAEIAIGRRRGLPPEAAVRLLKEFMAAFYLRILSRKEAAAIGRLIVREQTQPSPAFEILYDNAFRNLHETLCFLVGTALGADPEDRRTILHTHSLMGQVWFFAVSRETILRRLGWRTLEGKNAELVVQVLTQHVDLLLRALRPSSGAPERFSTSTFSP
jgi:TetR/AcrR family transcriptional regulator, regulator of cefoperazone and chloramphenicol sensitivity